MSTAGAPPLLDHLASPLTPAAPDVVGALAVFPLFGPAPRLRYAAFAQAIAAGVVVRERDGAAEVNDLVVENPTQRPVLLLDGEEVAGAQQDRTFDLSVLVAAGASLQVPVSCVERGRWDGDRHGEAFRPAAQTAYPELRRLKAQQVRRRLALGLEARAAQDEVWEAVERKHARHDVASSTGAMGDVFARRDGELEALRSGVAAREGQVGMLVAVGGRFSVLDHASDPAAFAALHGPLVRGYALDALEAPLDAGSPPSLDAAADVLGRACAAPTEERPGVGLGTEARFATGHVHGTGLVHDGELVQLTAFFEDAPAARVGRPSRRARR